MELRRCMSQTPTLKELTLELELGLANITYSKTNALNG